MARSHDLHSHSTRSDGTVSPTEVVERAAANGVSVLALTDHDVIDGIAEARQAADRTGIVLIPGVEISATWEGRTIHIVGLNVDVDDTGLQDGLASLRAVRDERGREIAARLEQAGIERVYEGASAYATGTILSRTHFARFLVDDGRATDIGRAFKRWLQKGRPGYVPTEWTPMANAVAWIRGAGGRAVLAHPARYPFSGGQMRRLLAEFRDAGGEGVEVVTGSHGPGDTDRFARLAVEFGLLASAGSDFHGPEIAWRDLGRLAPMPQECTPVWHDWPHAQAEHHAMIGPDKIGRVSI